MFLRRSYSRFLDEGHESANVLFSTLVFKTLLRSFCLYTTVLFWWTSHLSDRLMLLSTGDVINVLYFHRFGWHSGRECMKKKKRNYEDCPFHNSLQALISLELEWSWSVTLRQTLPLFFWVKNLIFLSKEAEEKREKENVVSSLSEGRRVWK